MRLPTPYRPEADIVSHRLASLKGALDWAAGRAVATPWVRAVRDKPPPFWAMESLLREYPISSAEGLALMRLAEALLRVPDAETAIALTADQLGRADFDGSRRLDAGAPVLLGHRAVEEVPARPPSEPRSRAGPDGAAGRPHRGGRDAARGAAAGPPVRAGPDHRRGHGRGPRRRTGSMRRCASATTCWAKARAPTPMRCATSTATSTPSSPSPPAPTASGTPEHNDGISIKLSALHPRYEDAQRERVMRELVPRVWQLCELAADANLNLTIDAEEVDRLELSLDVFEALAAQVAAERPQWRGFGLAMQAYQTRALELVEHVTAIARKYRLRLMCRLVKGAYWDARDQARAGAGPAALPGVHAQAPHRHELPGLRPRAAGGARCDLPAVRDAQRRHHRGHPADGPRAERWAAPFETAAPARHGRGRLPRGA